ncbi:hypothetical protein D9599_19745 [Roseomonas sp. KE2513]|uniref:hypothetical protein n=1 Tax=Roseomonas sp. KE2513 TaxID=2479202 RepID=UPI0018E05B1D|nr:hypothetical protein [Roseomonas sp. KE2513]MBI0537796.1 hypothetical protein [Roseomonas sp. KE2513]
MNRPTGTLAIALAALALAGPALAQSGPSSNAPDPAVREMQRARGNPAAVPYIPAQDRNAATADTLDVQTARGLMAEARAALVRRRAGMAVEALERAESRLLTNSVLASQANVPQSSAALSQLAAARRLAGQGDTRSALQALDRAEAALPASPTGPGATPLPEGVPTAIDVQPPVPPAVQPRPVRPRAAPAPALPGEAVPPRG